jgi:hypothetical protein
MPTAACSKVARKRRSLSWSAASARSLARRTRNTAQLAARRSPAATARATRNIESARAMRRLSSARLAVSIRFAVRSRS